jgi:membrane-associated phospholipid phosphatase
VAFSIVMGLSRAYLAAHWLPDATAGTRCPAGGREYV